MASDHPTRPGRQPVPPDDHAMRPDGHPIWTGDAPTLPGRRPVPAGAPAPTPTADWPLARRLLWLAFWLIVLGVGIGKTWDGWWHATHVFQGFFSPPHDFIYGMCLLASGVVLAMTLVPRVRLAFGAGFRVPVFPFPVPGPLALLGGALVLAGFAGLALDNFWHTTFGLDETGWSLPHAMIGWSVLMALLGAVACRLALRAAYPLRWYTTLLLGLLGITCMAAPVMGPLDANHTPDTVRAVASIPVLAVQPAFQHATRVVLAGNLMRTNPLLILLAPLWGGAGLAFARRLDARPPVLLAVVLLASGGGGAPEWARAYAARIPGLLRPENWAALPILLPGVLLVALLWLRLPERPAWIAFGLLFGLLVYLIWDAHATPAALPLILLAPVAALVGAALGRRAYAVVARPDTPRAVFSLLAVAFFVPYVTGAVDLYLRLHTP